MVARCPWHSGAFAAEAGCAADRQMAVSRAAAARVARTGGKLDMIVSPGRGEWSDPRLRDATARRLAAHLHATIQTSRRPTSTKARTSGTAAQQHSTPSPAHGP